MCPLKATGIPRRYYGSVPDHCNKVRITIEQVIVFLLVESLAFNLQEKQHLGDAIKWCAKWHAIKRGTPGLLLRFLSSTASLTFPTRACDMGLSEAGGSESAVLWCGTRDREIGTRRITGGKTKGKILNDHWAPAEASMSPLILCCPPPLIL